MGNYAQSPLDRAQSQYEQAYRAYVELEKKLHNKAQELAKLNRVIAIRTRRELERR